MNDEKVEFFDYVDDESLSSISRAVRDNDTATLRQILIDKKIKRRSARLSADNRGWTAMHEAASRSDRIECLELLLRYSEYSYADIDVNSKSYDGKTALFVACEEGRERNVELILKAGGDANAATLDGTSPLHVAAANGFVTVAHHLLRSGASVDHQDWQGFTGLHLAALYHQLPMCEVLLENGASSRLADSDGNLALHLACQRGHSAIVRLLLAKNDDDDVNRQNHDGIAPLMLAVRNGGNVECVNYLLERGASVSATLRSNDGFTALEYAAAGGNATVLRTILDRVRDVDLREIYIRRIEYVLKNQAIFYPAVCCALNSGSVDCLSALLESENENENENEMILEAPYVENSGHCTDVFCPLAYLLSVRGDLADETFDQFLRLLLRRRRRIVHATTNNSLVDRRRLERIEWPQSGVNFTNPLAVVFNSQWTDSDKFAYSAVLDEYDVTFDYCLQRYNDDHNSCNFEDFTLVPGYEIFYRPILDAVRDARVDVVGSLLTRSCILEPDRLCHYLVTTVLRWPSPSPSQSSAPRSYQRRQQLTKEFEKLRSVYCYLVELKPSYYNHHRYTGAASLVDLSLLSRDDEFSRSNLQQLCRNVVRQQLRGDTLRDNLRDFHVKIMALPLPTHLKQYLLFRN